MTFRLYFYTFEGSLDLVERIIKVNGFVNCDPNFVQISQVINGASELLVKVFGLERGAHARTAIGTSSLPFNGSFLKMLVNILIMTSSSGD